MSYRIILFWLLIFMAGSCASGSAIQSQPPRTTQLLQDLKNEKCCSENFTPSASMVEKYNLRQEGSTYYVGGFLSVSEQVVPSSVEKLGGTIGTQTDSIWTVQIPVQNLEKLLQTQGVKTFDVGRKVQMKKADGKQLQ